jgi:hypothetical protein
MPRLLALVFLASSGCLSVLNAGIQDDGGVQGTSSAGNGTSGSGTSGSAAGGNSSGGLSSTSSSGTTTGLPPCTYPVSTEGGLPQFPNTSLGDGWFNVTGALDEASGLGPEQDILTQLHCSGERYALIDISAVGAIYSGDFAAAVPRNYAESWLAHGGIVLTVLEQGGGQPPVLPASDEDLASWASKYGIDYSLVNDPSETLVQDFLVPAWPTEYVVRLSDMAIVDTIPGYDAFQAFTSTLAGDGGH